MKIKSIVGFVFLIALFSGALFNAHALNMSYDQIIWQADPGIDPNNLAGSVSMDFDTSTSQLIITLGNLTTNYSGGTNLPSSAILTGIGFNLGSVTVVGGSVALTNYIGTANPSSVWGFDNFVSGGPFKNIATLPVDTTVTTLSAAIQGNPNPSGVFAPGGVPDGPKDGILPAGYSGPIGPDYGYFSGSAVITLNLSGSVDLAAIDSQPIVLSFGSPTAPVPEPATLLLLGSGLFGLVGFRRFKK